MKRHPAVEDILQFFKFKHLHEDLQTVSRPYFELAHNLAGNSDLDGPELTVALRKLLESKDAAVRSAIHWDDKG